MTENKNQTIQVFASYGTTRTIAQIVTAIGWLVVGISVIAAFVLIIKALEARYGSPLAGLVPALFGVINGIVVVMMGQLTRAIVDNTDYNKQILLLLAKKENLDVSFVEDTPSYETPSEEYDESSEDKPEEFSGPAAIHLKNGKTIEVDLYRISENTVFAQALGVSMDFSMDEVEEIVDLEE